MATTDFVVKNGLVVTENAVVQETTDASSKDTGALVVEGGVGIEKKLYVGTDLNVGSNGTVTGDLAVNGGDLTTTATTFNLLDTNATTVNFAGAATTLDIGATSGTTSINNNVDIDLDLNVDGGDITTNATTFNLLNTNATTLNIGGAATTLDIGATSGTTSINNNVDIDLDLNVDGGDITTNATTFNLLNTNATTVNFAGAATALTIGSTSGTTTIRTPGLRIGGVDAGPNYIAFRGTTGDNPGSFNHTFVGERIHTASESSELLIFKGNDPIATSGPDRVRVFAGEFRVDTYTTATSGDFDTVGASANAINRLLITSNGNVTIAQDLAVNGGDLTTTATTFNLINTNATTLNIGGAATAIDIGSASGTTNISNNLDVDGNLSLNTADTATAATHYFVETGSDGIVRPKTLANVKSEVVTTASVNAAAATTVGTIDTGVWNGTTIGVAYGGTGQTTYTDGQLLIGNSTGNTLTKATLTGTSNRITITNGAGSITINADATSANTASKIVARDASGNFSAGTITASLSGNASTASKWATARTVTFAGGDVTGSFSIDGSANVSNVNLTIGANSVALGTDTTGAYVADVVAGTSISLSETADNAEGNVVTVNHADTSTLNGTYGGNDDGIVIEDITVDGLGHVTAIGTRDLDSRYTQTYRGDRTLSTTANQYVEMFRFSRTNGAHTFLLHTTVSDSSFSTSKSYLVSVGFSGTSNVYQILRPSANSGAYSSNDYRIEINSNAQDVTIRATRVSGSTAATLSFEVQSVYDANAATYTALTGTGTSTASVYYSSGMDADLLDGQQGSYYLDWTNVTNKPDPVITLGGDLSGSVTLTDLASGTLTATINANSVALGTDTTGSYVAQGATSGNGISGSVNSEGGTFTVTSNATNANTANTIVFRDASGNFSAGTITAALSGNASTASKWATARTITLGGDLTGNVSIDGSANVTLTATIAANSVALGTDTTGAYVADIVAGGAITLSETADNAEGNVVTVNHADTSSQASVNNSNGTVIQDVTLDTYGHVTGLASVDLDGRYLRITGSSLTGTLLVDQDGNNGNIAYESSGGCYIPRPLGGSYKTSTATITGALAIKLPTASWNQSDMLSFWVDVYDYAGGTEGESISIFVYGYQYSTGSWTNNGALILSDRTDKDYTVRFGHDGTRHIVYIAETTSSWSYPQVIVRDFQAGYSASYVNYDDAFAVTFETTLGTITSTSTNNYPVAKQLETARTISLTGDVTGSTTFDGSGNVSISATIAANSVALGTDTTGAYVADIVAGTSITLSETANGAENNTVTVNHADTSTLNGAYGSDGIKSVTVDALGHVTAITTGSFVDTAGDTMTGNLTFSSGADINFGSGSAINVGVSGEDNYVFAWAPSTNYGLTFNTLSTNPASGSYDFKDGTGSAIFVVPANSGNSSEFKYFSNTIFTDGYHPNADKWTTARTITLGGDLTGNVSIDGSANVTLTATIAANSVALGTDTTGAYVADIVAGTAITLSETANNAEGNVVTVNHSDTSTLNGTYGTDGVSSITVDSLGHVTAISTKSFVDTAGDTMTGVLVINTTNDYQLELRSSDTWTGILFNDSGAANDYLWYNGANGTFAIGGGGSSVSGKKLHVDGGMTIGASSDSVAMTTNGLYVEGDVTVNGGNIFTSSSQQRCKLGVWTDTTYGIGMQSGYTYGGLGNEYAMTFQMDATANRGFWWGKNSHSNAQGAMSLTTDGKLTVANSARIGFGESDTTSPGSSYTLHVNGSFAATTKSFVIDHPTKEGMKLRHGSLEGPEDGVYVRGRLKGNNVIELPDYWLGLVHEDSITVNLTAIGGKQDLWVEDIVDNTVVLGGENINCFYTVYGTRKDVDGWDVEF